MPGAPDDFIGDLREERSLVPEARLYERVHAIMETFLRSQPDIAQACIESFSSLFASVKEAATRSGSRPILCPVVFRLYVDSELFTQASLSLTFHRDGHVTTCVTVNPQPLLGRDAERYGLLIQNLGRLARMIDGMRE